MPQRKLPSRQSPVAPVDWATQAGAQDDNPDAELKMGGETIGWSGVFSLKVGDTIIQPIGQMGVAAGLRRHCKFITHLYEAPDCSDDAPRVDWPSSITIQVTQHFYTRIPRLPHERPGRDRYTSVEQKRWSFDINTDTTESAQLLDSHLLAVPAGNVGGGYEALFASLRTDDLARCRAAGQMEYISIKFRLSLSQTEGILTPIRETYPGLDDAVYNFHDSLSPGCTPQYHTLAPPSTHSPSETWEVGLNDDTTTEVLAPTAPPPVLAQLSGFINCEDRSAFEKRFKGFYRHWQPECEHSPYNPWLASNPSSNGHTLVRIRRGQEIQAPHLRPSPRLGSRLTYRDMPQWVLVEGFSIIYQEEAIRRSAKENWERDNELRVLQLNPACTHFYIGILRFGSDFDFHVDRFTVRMGNAEWATHVIEPLPFVSRLDYCVILVRPLNHDKTPNTFEIPEVFDMSLPAPEGQSQESLVYAHCHTGPCNVVQVTPRVSDTSIKVYLNHLAILNPEHRNERGFYDRYIERWDHHLLGQDLRIHSTSNVFGDLTANQLTELLKSWGVTLTDEQTAAMIRLTELPNAFGIVDGPPGTGKTELDIVTIAILLSQRKKVRILSPTNATLDDTLRRLHTFIDARASAGVWKPEYSQQAIIRVHPKSTESRLIDIERSKVAYPGLPEEQELELGNLEYEYQQLIASYIQAHHDRQRGSRDTRVVLPEWSLGRQFLLWMGLLSDPSASPSQAPSASAPSAAPHPSSGGEEASIPTPPPSAEPQPSSGGEEASVPTPPPSAEPQPSSGGEEASIIDSSTAHDQNENPPNVETQEKEDGDEDNQDAHSSGVSASSAATGAVEPGEGEEDPADNEPGDDNTGSRHPRPLSEEEQMVRATRDRIEKAQNEGGIESVKDMYRTLFPRQHLTSEEKILQSQCQIDLLRYFVSNEVGVIACTPVTAGQTPLNHFPHNHTIFEEVSRARNPDILVALATSPADTTVGFSGDIHQLTPLKFSTKEDIFANYTNKNMIRKLLDLGIHRVELTEQSRTIRFINDITSRVYYAGRLTTNVDLAQRPNVPRMQRAVSDFTGGVVNHPAVWIDYGNTEVTQSGATKSKINDKQSHAMLVFALTCVRHGIPPKEIMMIAAYKAQARAMEMSVRRDPALRGITVHTIDGAQGKESSIVIIGWVSVTEVGFVDDRGRLCVAQSRARDGVFHICDYQSFQHSNPHKRRYNNLTALRQAFMDAGAYFPVPAGQVFAEPTPFAPEEEVRQRYQTGYDEGAGGYSGGEWNNDGHGEDGWNSSAKNDSSNKEEESDGKKDENEKDTSSWVGGSQEELQTGW
ncbi:MAG: hypothetical protein Q9224_000452 [Gallowayella concinna]